MYQIQDSLQQLHVRLSNSLGRGNHLHINIRSLKGEVWAHETRLTPPLFIEVHVGMYICARVIILPLSLQFFC